MMIAAMASEEQIARWIEPTMNRGALLTGCGAEPQGSLPSTATRVKGGFRVSGTKHYATNAGLAEWLWIGSVGFEGQPRALMFMVHKDTVGLKIDAEVWQPMGMRACVSPWIHLENCFVPDENLLGRPGQFLAENWLGKINFAFTANYLGSARAIYDSGLSYVRARGAGKDPYRQVRFGELKSLLDASRLLLYNAVRMFKEDPEAAMVAAHEANGWPRKCYKK
jgi:alkylation response protein AidB-like acyl-CoA dehydrogenase